MSSTPRKGDLIINPDTQRPVRVGSRTWINLVKKGVLQGHYSDNNVIEEQYAEIPPEQMEQKMKLINEKLPYGTQAVRGRGKYANKIVKRNRPLTQEQLTKTTIKKASKVVANHIDELDEVDYDEMEKKLEQLIMQEMLNTRPQNNPQKFNQNERPIKRKQVVEYEEQDDDNEEQDINDNNDDDDDY